MLQRPQTLYMLGSFLLSLVLCTGPLAILTTPAGEIQLSFSSLKGPGQIHMEMAMWPMASLFVLVSALSFLNIFFYRNRVRQMRLTIFLILLFAGSIAMIALYVVLARNQLENSGVVLLWRVVIPPVNVILNYLAFRLIRRDELLVKAYDRIR